MGQVRAVLGDQVADTSSKHDWENEMNIGSDGAEIDHVRKMQVYGNWIKFVDGDGSSIKILPSAVKQLMMFALEHVNEFEEGAWE